MCYGRARDGALCCLSMSDVAPGVTTYPEVIIVGQNLRDTCGGTGIGKFDVPCNHENNSNPSLHGGKDRVASFPDASPRVNP